MKAVFEGPDDAVSKLQAETLADSINVNIDGEDFAIIAQMIADLPAQAPVICQYPRGLPERFSLFPQIVNKPDAFLISLANVVRRRGNHQPRGPIRYLAQQIQTISSV